MGDIEDLAARNDQLNARMNAAGGPGVLVAGLERGYRRVKRNQRLTIIGLALDAVLTIVGIILLATVNTNTGRIAHNSTTAAVSCQAGNDFRQADHELWNRILAMPGIFTSAQGLEIQNVVSEVFVLRTC